MSDSNNSSEIFELYRKTGDICAYLNFTGLHLATDEDTNIRGILTSKFDDLEAAGLHLSKNFFLELFLSSMLRQFTVSRCFYEFMLAYVDSIKESHAASLADGYIDPLWPALIVPSFMSVPGILFNISLLIVSARKISMITICNWLIAFDSFCQIPAMLPFLVNLFAACFGFDHVDPSVCLISLMLSTASSYASFLAMYVISLERLLIVMWAMRMSQISERTLKQCSFLVFLVCTCFGVAMIFVVFNVKLDTSLPTSIHVYCSISFFVHSLNVYYISHTLLGLTVLNYVLIAFRIVWRRIYMPNTLNVSNNSFAYSEATNRMLRCVIIISIVLLIGWLIGLVLMLNLANSIIRLLSEKMGGASTKVKSPTDIFFNNLFIWLSCPLISVFPVIVECTHSDHQQLRLSGGIQEDAGTTFEMEANRNCNCPAHA